MMDQQEYATTLNYANGLISKLQEENNRLRKALEEALDRICSAQPNAAGFILAEALKEKD